MKKTRTVWILVGCVVAGTAITARPLHAQPQPPATQLAKPTPGQLAFQDMELGVFIK